MKVFNIPFPVVITSLIFTATLTLFFISSHDMESDFNAIDQRLLIWTNSHHNSFLDKVMLHVGSLYFWVPFYCFLILMLLAYDKVRFMRIISFIALYLVIQAIFLFLFNGQFMHIRPLYQQYLALQLHISLAGKGVAYGCLPAVSNTVGIAVLVCLYFNHRYWPLKLITVAWAVLLLYSRMYAGWNFPDEIFLGTFAGLALSYLSFTAYKHYLNRHYAN